MARNTVFSTERTQENLSAVWGYPGELIVVEGIHSPVELSLLPGWKVRMNGVWMNLEEEPVGGSVVCDIGYSDQVWNTPRAGRSYTSIFNGTFPTIGNGMIQNEGVYLQFSPYPEPLELRNRWQPEGTTKKILFRASITQVGATNPGKGLTLKLDMIVIKDY
jgi:hypothetical protein